MEGPKTVFQLRNVFISVNAKKKEEEKKSQTETPVNAFVADFDFLFIQTSLRSEVISLPSTLNPLLPLKAELVAIASMDGVGAELWALVHHLYAVKPSPVKAIEELSLRTNEKFDAGDVAMASSAREIVYTRWYGAMKSRFKLLREQLATSRQAEEVLGVVEGLFPQGVAPARLVEAFVSIAALLTSAVDDATVAEAAQVRVAHYQAKKVPAVSAKDVARDFVTGPLVTSLVPALWWLPPSGGGPVAGTRGPAPPSPSSAAKLATVTRMALLVSPPTIVLQYIKQGKRHRRSIRLDSPEVGFTPTSPLAGLVKRLRKSHGSLVADDTIRSLLLQLQRLMRESAADGQSTEKVTPPSPAAVVSVKSNKADLGLLYRDPDAALDNVDLQDADDFTVKEFKARMNEKFEKNVVKPGDPGYKYDKRVVVKPTAKSEWDDD
jgi:centrosomal protein CEP19